MRRKLTYLDIEPGERVPLILFSGGYPANRVEKGVGAGEKQKQVQLQATDDDTDQQLADQPMRFILSTKMVVLSTGGVVFVGVFLYAGYRYFSDSK